MSAPWGREDVREGSLTLRCQHLTQKMQEPVRSARPAIPPNTMGRSIGQAWMNSDGKTARQREECSAPCPLSGQGYTRGPRREEVAELRLKQGAITLGVGTLSAADLLSVPGRG